MQFNQLVGSVVDAHDQLHQRAAAAVNQSLTLRNWLIGFYIVEFEQAGEDRAQYGEKLIPRLAEALEEHNVDGVSVRSLKLFRQFYQVYPQIGQTVSAQLQLPHNQGLDQSRGKGISPQPIHFKL